MLDSNPVAPFIWPVTALRATEAAPRPAGNSQFSEVSVSHLQANNPVAGGALDSGNRPVAVGVTFSSR